MSFLTTLLETTPHFGLAIEKTEKQLKKTNTQSAERLKLLVHLSYCYAHVQLQKGVSIAEEAITLADTRNDQNMKANALCAKAMNLFRIGYIARAQATAQQALFIFEHINDEEGKCDACFQLGCMPYMSIGPGDIPGYLKQALNRYKALGNESGVYLARIQQTLQLFLDTQFDEGLCEINAIIEELSVPHRHHLLCFAHMQISFGMYIKQDVTAFMERLLEWQKLAQANGNFHDCTIIKVFLSDCYRMQHLTKDVMKACLESIQYTDKLGSIHGHITVSIVMANILSGQGQYADALLYYRKAMDAACKIEDGYKYLMSLNAIGEVHLKLGQIREARESFETVRNEANRTNDRLNLIAAQRHLAELAYQQGEFDRALFDFKILFDTPNNSDGWNIQDFGNYASSIAKASDAALQGAGLKPEERNMLRLHYLEKYLDLTQQQINNREEANACSCLADYYEEINDLNHSIHYRKKYIQLYTELVNEENMKSMSNLRMQYETEKKEQEIVLLRKEGEQALLNERLRISRELHDDIGSTLGSISIYSEVATNRSQKNKNANEAISKIGIASRELIDKMSDIVWSTNPNNESFEQLQNRMQAFAAMILTPRNIQYNFNANEAVKNIQLTAEERKNIFLIYKEAIHNIVKYAGCSTVEIRLSLQNKQLGMTIKDDGKGFDFASQNTKVNNKSLGGNGLKNMQIRASDIHAEFNISSSKNKGATIKLNLKV